MTGHELPPGERVVVADGPVLGGSADGAQAQVRALVGPVLVITVDSRGIDVDAYCPPEVVLEIVEMIADAAREQIAKQAGGVTDGEGGSQN